MINIKKYLEKELGKMIKKIFEFIKKVFCVGLDVIYAIGAFFFNGIKKLILMIVGVFKTDSNTTK